MKRENDLLVDGIVAAGYLRSPAIIAAMKKVDRINFVPQKYEKYAYADEPLPIGQGQTISQPLTVAYMTECLDVHDGQRILEIGAGSGYQAAILAELNPKGKIYTIERIPGLAEMAKSNLKKYKNVEAVGGCGVKGLKEKAPFDRIIATCACRQIPAAWIDQLKKGGKIVAPVGVGFFQQLVRIEKNDEIITVDLNFPCAFVPLVEE